MANPFYDLPLSDKFHKPIEKGPLTGEDFFVRTKQIEPFRAVAQLGETLGMSIATVNRTMQTSQWPDGGL
jgi:hypothetical protein